MSAVLPRPTYAYMPPEKHGAYVYGAEQMSMIVEEVMPLHWEHWKETETLYRSDFFNPDYEAFIRGQEAGQFIIFTARHETAQLVGNLIFNVRPDMTAKETMIADENAFFISAPHRKGRVAVRLLDYAERCLKELGVNSIGMTDKSPCGGADLSRFLGRRGYTPVAVHHVKNLG